MCTVKVQHVTHLQVNCGTTSNDDTRYLVKFGKIYIYIYYMTHTAAAVCLL